MPSSNKRIPSHEAIERRAYEIYIEGGSVDGNDVANWLAAEEELMSRAEEAEAAKVAPAADLRPAPMRKSVTAS
jgi:TPP-dependent pyruvate/acetoin dehydrogenase alpha subunit